MFSARFARLAYIPINEFRTIWQEQGCSNPSSMTKLTHIKEIFDQFRECPLSESFSYYSTDKGITSGEAGGDVYIICNKDRLVIAFRGTEFTVEDGFSAQDVMQDLKAVPQILHFFFNF